MDFKNLLTKMYSIEGRQVISESKEDMEYYFGKEKKSTSKDRETDTGHMAKKTDKGTQYTKKDLPGQDTSKDADTKAAEKRAKKKSNESISDILKTLDAIKEGRAEVDEEDTQEGNEFSGELAKAKAAGKKDFEVDGKKYQVKESDDDDADDKDDKDKEAVEESHLKEKAAPGQEDWIKSNKARFIKQYGKEKGLEVLYATAQKRSKKNEDIARISECYDQAMGQQEQESGMNINASTDTRTGSKSLTVTAQGEAAEQLAQILKLSGLGGGAAPEAGMEEAYVNEPNPETQGIEVQIAQGNDLNRAKNMHQHSYRQGDNPMAMTEAKALKELEKRLNEELAAFKVIAEKKSKPDFLDMDKDGDKKEPMKKALADKSQKKKVSESAVLTEADLQTLIKKFGMAAVTAAALAGLGGTAQAQTTPSYQEKPAAVQQAVRPTNKQIRDIDDLFDHMYQTNTAFQAEVKKEPGKYTTYKGITDRVRDANKMSHNNKVNLLKKFKALPESVSESRTTLQEADLQSLIKKFGMAAVTAAALAGLGGTAQARPNIDDPGSYKVPVPISAPAQQQQSSELQDLARYGVKAVKDLGNDFTQVRFQDRDGVFDGHSNQIYFYSSKTDGLEKVTIKDGRMSTDYTSASDIGLMTRAAFQKAGIPILQGGGINIGNKSPADGAVRPYFASQSQPGSPKPKSATIQ